MILNEETFDILNFDVPDVTNADIEVADIDATVPEAGPEVGVETLLMQAIKDIYGMIEGYNSLSIALTDIGNEPAAVAIADIIRMEHSNIGALQDILKEISPNAEAVDINESLNEDNQYNIGTIPYLGKEYIEYVINNIDDKGIIRRGKRLLDAINNNKNTNSNATKYNIGTLENQIAEFVSETIDSIDYRQAKQQGNRIIELAY